MKREKLAPILARCAGSDSERHYLAFFDCFKRGEFFEAHEVLEQIWLPERGRTRDRFYKGLIQLAGAFVHLRKNRAGPGKALLRLAKSNLELYAPRFEGLDVASAIAAIDILLHQMQSAAAAPSQLAAPLLELDWQGARTRSA